MSENYNELKKYIYEDGYVDGSEMQFLQDLVAAEPVTQATAELLLDLLNLLEGHEQNQDFYDLVVEGTTRYIENTEKCSEASIKWLKSKMDRDGQIDATEQRIIDRLGL